MNIIFFKKLLIIIEDMIVYKFEDILSYKFDLLTKNQRNEIIDIKESFSMFIVVEEQTELIPNLFFCLFENRKFSEYDCITYKKNKNNTFDLVIYEFSNNSIERDKVNIKNQNEKDEEINRKINNLKKDFLGINEYINDIFFCYVYREKNKYEFNSYLINKKGTLKKISDELFFNKIKECEFKSEYEFKKDLINKVFWFDQFFFIKNIIDDWEKHKPLLSDEEIKIFDEINKNNQIIIKGDPGTGKTILGFKLFSSIENSIFFMKNIKFGEKIKNYYSHKNATFPNTIFFNEEEVCEYIKNNNFSTIIIDEAQRMTKNFFDRVLKNKKFIIFGDDNQKINIKLEKWRISSISSSYKTLEIKSQKRTSDKSIRVIKYLILNKYNNSSFNIDKEIIDIDVFDDFYLFVKEFRSEFYEHKCLCTLEHCEKDSYNRKILSSMNIKFINSNLEFRPVFDLYPEVVNEYCVYPYDVVSREYDAIYIFLGSEIIFNEKIIDSRNKLDISFLRNQIYILSSRAIKKIRFFIINKGLREEIKRKIKTIYK